MITPVEPDNVEIDEAAARVVELGNSLLEENQDTDQWDVASGLLAGAIQYWLYSHQPCGDPSCEACDEIRTAQQRLRKLLAESKQLAEDSDYFHFPQDTDVGTA